ncbi:hypothetical protein DENSPDRAFT_561388 [Dentipellis sp. KUC8613]|nr:hypothetical protein DENSPDRAFT_561388 [Dentipellis sp. KUC8613]
MVYGMAPQLQESVLCHRAVSSRNPRMRKQARRGVPNYCHIWYTGWHPNRGNPRQATSLPSSGVRDTLQHRPRRPRRHRRRRCRRPLHHLRRHIQDTHKRVSCPAYHDTRRRGPSQRRPRRVARSSKQPVARVLVRGHRRMRRRTGVGRWMGV